MVNPSNEYEDTLCGNVLMSDVNFVSPPLQ